MPKTKVGIIGVGNISGIYLEAGKKFDCFEYAAIADLIPERAQTAAQNYNIPKVCSPDELYADPNIEIVLNLTIPKVHAEVNLAAIAAGKSTYCEKPLGVNRAEGIKTIDEAKKKNVRVGCAPDTFLGAGGQTCRKLIDDGWIGKPISFTAFMMCHGHESWHPEPEFYYKVGGGPMFDMGPYYLTALINLLGPVKKVSGMTKKSFDIRRITSQPKFGTLVDVEVPTHVIGLLEFECGAIGTIITSFDIWDAKTPCIEIYGTEGTLSVPDPNCFDGPVFCMRQGGGRMEVPLTHTYKDNTRGIGLADMAVGIQNGRPHRASGELAMHVLDVMETIHTAYTTGQTIELSTTCAQPKPLPMGLAFGQIDK